MAEIDYRESPYNIDSSKKIEAAGVRAALNTKQNNIPAGSTNVLLGPTTAGGDPGTKLLSEFVQTSGNQTIYGVKTFNNADEPRLSSNKVRLNGLPAATNVSATKFATEAQVYNTVYDNCALKSQLDNMATTNTQQDISGIKKFTSYVTFTDAATNQVQISGNIGVHGSVSGKQRFWLGNDTSSNKGYLQLSAAPTEEYLRVDASTISHSNGSGGWWYVDNSGHHGTSDRRLKKNIRQIQDTVLDKLNKVNIVNFNYTSDDEQPVRVGVIAQEVRKLFPEMITENEDGYLSIVESKFVYYLIKGLQEQQKQLDDLRAQINKLK